MLGFCLPRNTDDNLWVAMVTELGESVDLIKLLQMSWEDRLRVSKTKYTLDMSIVNTSIINFLVISVYRISLNCSISN